MSGFSMTALRRFATPLVVGGFLVVGVTGVMMFFHLQEPIIKEAHEWVGIAFAVAALLHVTTHLPALKRYVKQPAALALAAVMLVVGVGMLELDAGANPYKVAAKKMPELPLSVVASVAQVSVDELLITLREAGIDDAAPEHSLAALAESNGQRSIEDLMSVVFLANSNHQ